MANKNTRLLRRLIATATRLGSDHVIWQKPVYNYHSNPEMTSSTFPTAIRRANGVNSVNAKRNTCQVVYHNVGEGGVKFSATAHEIRDKNRPAIFPNHGYLEYRRGSAG